MFTEILSSASAHATLSWDDAGWVVEQDRRIFRAGVVDVRRIFGDDALEASAEFNRSGSKDWSSRRVKRLGEQAADHVRRLGWTIDLLDDTRFSAHRGGWTMTAASDLAGVAVGRFHDHRLVEGGHTVDAGAIDDAVISWSEGSSAVAPSDSADWTVIELADETASRSDENERRSARR